MPTKKSVPTLLLLDGHSLAYRAFYALREVEMSTTTGQPTNAVFGFTSMLINLMRDEEPTHVAVAFDVSRKTFRSEAYADYKAGRSETPDDFRGQVTLIREVLDALRIPTMMVEGFEADDVIATVTGRAVEAGLDVLICTGDRDALQLVNEHVTVLYPKRGVSEMTRFTPDEVQAKYGLSPAQYPDYAALRGDPSDNLPGIPGVGEKTAAKWVREYGSLRDLIERIDTVKGKVGDALREHVASVELNRRLTELVRDVDLDVELDALERQQWDRDEVHRLFDDLQFRVLRERLFATVEAAAPEADEGFDVSFERLATDDASQWIDEHARDGARVAVAFRGTWGRGVGNLTGVALASGDGASAYLDPERLSPDDEKALAAWLADADVPKAVHDVKGPLLALRQHGWALAGVTSDTQLAAYLLRPDTRAFDLADLALRYLHRELRSNEADEANGQLTLDGGLDESDDALAEAETVRATAVRDLAEVFDTQLDANNALRLLIDMELPLAYVLADMEAVGIAADTDALLDLQKELGDGVKVVEGEAHTLVGREFNLGSPKQLQEILFDQFGLPKTKRIKTGYTTDADSLADLYAKTEHPVLELLLRHREVARLKSVVDGLLPLVDDHGRIHTTFNQTVAATGRLSSTDPNLQNIPVRTAEGRRIRETFVVGEGYESLMTADYSQIEMRIMAHLSKDAGLIEAFTTGEDLHTFVASRAFDIDPADVDPEMRRRIKAMSYGLAYGLSAFGLSRQLKISADEARGQMDAYFTRFGGVRDYLHSVVEDARQTGFTETIMGRRRYLSNLTSDNRNLREMAERAALNAPIQGSAADIIKVAMLRVFDELSASDLRSRLLLQVHDELVLEIAPGEREAVEELVRRQMGGAYELDVPMDVSVGIGRTWHEAAH
ncbi:DNA polymerase I [Jatrophihabitans endophyticus]|uniref:DNA polymerase I n=1 Tax=Jatrophihabitans endophyticus TaxID=1206085 RepID=UPI0019EF46DF|nr:DNA polymerase I [Jatrophihabitans endophyticus]MBE7188211.1 DNA polymerase I [Jatrophihabitans endophyticus]